MPGEHPPPPDDLARRDLPLVQLRRTFWRVNERSYDDPLYFGSSGRHRFDSADGKFGVCYLAFDVFGAFIEVFGRPPGTKLVALQALEDRQAIEATLSRPLDVVDLTGSGLSRIGADTRLSGGGDYELSQMWASAIYDHPSVPDGIVYRSRHDPERKSLAAFDRCSDVFEVKSTFHLADKEFRSTLVRVLDHYGFAIG